jgi:hypothetical protein
MGLTVIRTASEWSTFLAATACQNVTSTPSIDFSVNTLLIFNPSSCCLDPRLKGYSFVSACAGAGGWDVQTASSYENSIMAAMFCGTQCTNVAALIPKTTLPIHWTWCETNYDFGFFQNTTCTTTVIP